MITVKIKESPEEKAILQAVGSKNTTESRNAMEAFAAFVTPVVQEALMQASTSAMIYKTLQYDEDDHPSIPLDLYFDEGTEFVQTWSQEMAGGLGTSHIEGMKEMKFSTYTLNSAVSFNKKYARKCRLNVLEKALQRMINELVVKQERNAWVPILREFAEGNINGTQVTFIATTAGQFDLDGVNKMITRMGRINQSFASGTPSNYQSKGLTNLVMSLEMKEAVRAMVYEPMNTRVGTMTSNGATAVPLPDAIRTEMYRSAGSQSIFGIEIAAINELGINQKYNTLFDTLAGATTFVNAAGGGSAAFAATDELVCGFDLSRDNFIRPVIIGENGSETDVRADDQFFARQDKVGFYTALEEGRVGLDARACVGLIV